MASVGDLKYPVLLLSRDNSVTADLGAWNARVNGATTPRALVDFFA